MSAPVRIQIELRDLDLLDLVESVADRLGRASGLDEDAAHWLSMAVRECVVNALVHGNRRDPSKSVEVEFTSTPSAQDTELRVSVRDQGDGFDVTALPDPLAPENLLRTSGRGVLLIGQFVDNVSYLRRPEGGMEVRMVRRIPC